MKELEVKTGGLRVYATDIRDAQLEALQPLQEFISNLGAIVISGCAITSNVGTPANWDIAAGFVAIRHADGFKVARFAGTTNVALPGYMTISKTTNQGNYGAPGSPVLKDRSYSYDATFAAGAPVAGNDTELVISAGAVVERLQYVPSAWQDSNTFNYFTDGFGTVTVAGGDVVYNKYKLTGKTLLWQIELRTVTIAGSVLNISITMPQPLRDLGFEFSNPQSVQVAGWGDGSVLIARLAVDSFGDPGQVILIFKADGTGFTTGTNNQTYSISIVAEVYNS